MTVWRIFKLVLAAGLLWFSIESGVFAYHLNTLLGQAEKPLLRKPVDFSKKGATYHGIVDNISNFYAHGLAFRIDTPREFESYEQAKQVLSGLELAVEWKGRTLKKPIQYVLDERGAYAYQPGRRGFVPAYLAPRRILEAGRYELSLKVLKPCRSLEGIPQRLVVCYEICELEAMQRYVALTLAILLGLAGLVLLGLTLYQWRTGIT